MADMLATPTDLAALLQRDVDTASATLALEVCTAVVQAAAGQRIVRVVDDAVTLPGGTDRYLRLPERPVVSVASVTLDGTLLTAGTASGTYRVSGNALYIEDGWLPDCSAPSDVAVVYTHGYAAGDQRLQLGRGMSLSLARGLFTNPDGTIREQIDDYAVAYAEAAAALEASAGMSGLLRKQYGSKAGLVRIG